MDFSLKSKVINNQIMMGGALLNLLKSWSRHYSPAWRRNSAEVVNGNRSAAQLTICWSSTARCFPLSFNLEAVNRLPGNHSSRSLKFKSHICNHNAIPSLGTYCSGRRSVPGSQQRDANLSPEMIPGDFKELTSSTEIYREVKSIATMVGGELAAWCRWLQRLHGKVAGIRWEEIGSTSASTCKKLKFFPPFHITWKCGFHLKYLRYSSGSEISWVR